MSAAAGIILRSVVLIPVADPLFRYASLQRPSIYDAFVWSFGIFLFTTPFLLLSVCFSLVYIHFYEEETAQTLGNLPEFPEPRDRQDLFLILGELHHQLEATPASHPQWLSIPEKGLYTGVAALGAIGSGKTRGLILPAMHQLFGYKADDPQKKLSGIVLEVKGDLCRQVARILKGYGREQDYIGVSLDSNIRYNPLNNDLDPYAQAFNIASIITSIWGKGKEPFWQQSYTDLVRYVIILYRVQSGYVTLVDIFRTVISSGRLEELLADTSCQVSNAGYVVISEEDYSIHAKLLAQFRIHVASRFRPVCGRILRGPGEVPAKRDADQRDCVPPQAAQCAPVHAIRQRQLLVLGTLEVLSPRGQDLDHPRHRCIPVPL